MNNWNEQVREEMNKISATNIYIKQRLKEDAEFSRCISLCVERFVAEKIEVDGWVLYDVPLSELFCFIKKDEFGNELAIELAIDFEIYENTNFPQNGYAIPCVTINSEPLLFNTISEIFSEKLCYNHDILSA